MVPPWPASCRGRDSRESAKGRGLAGAGTTRRFVLDLAGQEWTIEVTAEAIATVHAPLIARMRACAAARGGRCIVFVAGPPGSGKTTLCALWARLAGETPGAGGVQVLPVDGFHYPNAVLDATTISRAGGDVTLRSIKGCPETYDLAALSARLAALHAGTAVRWPYYDRALHDVVPDAIAVASTGILLVEGNYLLLDEPGWRELRSRADLSLFIESSPETLADVLQRLLRGGRSRDDALKHHLAVDHANYRRVMDNRCPADIVLAVDASRSIVMRETGRPPS